jgi:excisionase family DNA binding protein
VIEPVIVTVSLNGVRVPLELDADALDAIATALNSAESTDTWPMWMNVETAARYLDVSVERLRKLKDSGSVPFVQERPGARVFHNRDDLDAWMRAQGVQPQP